MSMESVLEVIRGISWRSGLRLEWMRVKSLGQGGYGFVHLAKVIEPFPRLLAVKCSPSPSLSLQKEYRVLRTFLGCQNIVQSYEQTFSVEYEVEYHNLFLEYALGGSLLNLINSYGGKIPESDVKCCTRMIHQGLCDVHGRGYVHCDIKPANILVYPSHQPGSPSTLKIADFGVAKEPGERDDVNRRSFQGTAQYMSPESVEHGKISAAVDIWSLGCVVAEMMTGAIPWESADDSYDLAMKIIHSRDAPIDIPQDISMAGKDFLMRCFTKDPHERWSAEKLIAHPFVSPQSPLLPPQKVFLPHQINKGFKRQSV
ncbi:hypothetical protein DITRI_Ditri17bG0095500 [Diplodiscus trichospermus]